MSTHYGELAREIILQQRLADPVSLALMAFDRYVQCLAERPRPGSQLDLFDHTPDQLDLWRSTWHACEREAVRQERRA